MSMFCEPPALISMDGDWEENLNFIYNIFLHDFVENNLVFNKSLVLFNNGKDSYDNRYLAFWHLITKQNDPSNRIPDFKRCAKIAWPRYIIEKCSGECDEIKKWVKYDDRKKRERVYLWCEKNRYVVVLEKRHSYYFFITSYNVEHSYVEDKFNKDYNNWLKTKTPI